MRFSRPTSCDRHCWALWRLPAMSSPGFSMARIPRIPARNHRLVSSPGGRHGTKGLLKTGWLLQPVPRQNLPMRRFGGNGRRGAGWLFCAVLLLSICAEAQTPARGLLMISIDGLRPDYVLKADEHGLKIPHLRRILQAGAHATGVRGVLPTVTYPSHTTLLTGVWPARHGVYSNLTFDPFGRNLGGWYWYSEDIAAPTLWEAAASAGMKVGSVSWPVSVGAAWVHFNVPEYWRAPKSADDLKLLRAIATPGLVAEIARQAGPYVVDLDAAIPGDLARSKYAAWIMRNKKPRFMTVHLAALDHLQHAAGPFSPEANDALERTDALVGQLEEAAGGPDFAVCIVSDHGFARTSHSLDLMTAFVSEGLITLAPATSARARQVVDWQAFPKVDGGSAAV